MGPSCTQRGPGQGRAGRQAPGASRLWPMLEKERNIGHPFDLNSKAKVQKDEECLNIAESQ